MTYIKAIETEYKGYRFRSRLEARWAVFFDAMGLQWQYEIEGFELPSGERYLPDFYFPDLIDRPTYIEIKPELPDAKSREGKRIREFTIAIRPKMANLILWGYPDPEKRVFMGMPCEENGFGLCALGSLDDLGMPGEILLVGLDFPDKNTYAETVWSHTGMHPMPPGVSFWATTHSSLIKNALSKARKARFEHGENPEPIQNVLARLQTQYIAKHGRT